MGVDKARLPALRVLLAEILEERDWVEDLDVPPWGSGEMSEIPRHYVRCVPDQSRGQELVVVWITADSLDRRRLYVNDVVTRKTEVAEDRGDVRRDKRQLRPV